MKRLTFDGNFCDIAKCADVCEGIICEEEACSQRKTWERLKDIEDILGNVYDLDSLRKLVRADREGRYMILPRGGYSKQDGEKALKHAVFGCQMYDNAVNKYIADAVAEKLARESAEKEMEMEGNRNVRA